MTIHAPTWVQNELVTETKMDNMNSDDTNDTDDIHTQYTGDQDAANTFTCYIRTDEVTSGSINTTGESAIVTTTVAVTWENGAFDSTNYRIVAGAEVTVGDAAVFISDITNITTTGCTIKVCIAAHTGGAISATIKVHAIAVRNPR